MDASSPRWNEVTESDHPHERRALEHVRALLPERAPFRAWSNFSFVADRTSNHECDLLVSTPAGLALIEIKSFRGRLTNDGPWWQHGNRSPYKTPFPLAERKAKELKMFLETEARGLDLRSRVPYVTAAIFLSEPDLDCALDSYQRVGLYAPEDARNDLPRLGRDLLFARPSREPVSREFDELLPRLLRRIGIAGNHPERWVGSWQLETHPYEEGPTWQDFHASRTIAGATAHRRIRVYLRDRLPTAEARASAEHAAEREFRAVQGMRHPGVLVPTELGEHELGPALVIDQAADARRLDQWLVSHKDLTLPQRLALLRQVVDAVAYAHDRRLVHRALSPRAVVVESGPTLRIGEWQVAARGLSSSRATSQVTPTSMAAGHLDPTVDPYLAPEFAAEADGSVDLDVFGVGALAYLLLTGMPPATGRDDLIARLEVDDGLDPQLEVAALNRLVLDATRPKRADRTASVDDIRSALNAVVRELRDGGQRDPWEAVPDEVLPGGYRVLDVLGTGGSARAFLVLRDGLRSVLKIGSSPAAERLLTAEASALEDLRHEHLVVLRRGVFRLGTRYAIELSVAGRQVLGGVLDTEGPFIGERLHALGDELLAAVAYLAKRGVVHRDITPANIGLSSQGHAVLFDFSLAASDASDTLSGTPGFRDPQLGTADRPTYDAAADLYATAATLHHAASLAVPRWGDDGTDPRFVAEATLAFEAFDGEHRDALVAFFRTALARDVAERFRSADAMRAAWNAIFQAPAPTERMPTVMTLDVHVDVIRQLRALDTAGRRERVDALRAAATPPRLAIPAGARDDRLRLLAVSEDLCGVVLPSDDGRRGLLLRLLPPVEALAWAQGTTVSVNPNSGALEFRDAVGLDRITEELTRSATEQRLFAEVDDDALRGLGVDERVIAVARSLSDPAGLEAAQPFLPEEQYSVLLALAAGRSVEQVRLEVTGPRGADGPVDATDVDAARARSAGTILVLEDLAELHDYLARPISQWKTFLHPAQRSIAYRRSYWGSAQVTGGPGTGKTVAALHRVKHLVESRDLGPGRVLLTTFTKSLASVLERDLRQMLDADRVDRVQVLNVNRYAAQIVRKDLGRSPTIVRDEDARWQAAIAEAGTSASQAFLEAEWEHVVLAQRITDEETYLQCDRSGRGRGLRKGETRRPLWTALSAYERGLRRDGVWTHLMVCDEAARLLAERDKSPFDHVVVDEVQDLHPAQWRLLRAAVKKGPDDLFLTGDPHQRIYANRVSLKQVGISVAGRSAKLNLNYRTSAEILRWALTMLGHGDDVGMDDSIDDLATYRSSFTGEPPTLAGARSQADEMAGMVEAVQQWHADGIDWEDIAVVGRSKGVWKRAEAALARAGVPVVELGVGDGSAVRVGTLHNMKGLEFRAVAAVGVSAGTLPRSSVTPESEDPVLHEQETQVERNVLFVAATRARERLRVSWSGNPSPFLPALTDAAR